MEINTRKLGNTGLMVFPLGLGAGQIGDISVSEKEVEFFLNSVLDEGINLIDTARGYGASEERIGKYLSKRRDEFILSTKVGYGIEGFGDWTYDCIIAGVDEALNILRTDYIDIVHLHSCSSEILKNNGVIDALLKTVEAGKIKFAAYSGENEDLEYALSTNKFDVIQTSINFADQKNIQKTLPETISKGIGVIAKRAIANAPWRFAERPTGHYAEKYWERWEIMNLDFDMDWNEIAVRFTAFTPGVGCSLIGTNKREHLKQNIAFVRKGELPPEIYKRIRDAFIKNDNNWISLL